MEEAELCQKVGFINQGRLIALDTPVQLKQTQMRGQVLEIRSTSPDRVVKALKAAQQSGQIPLDEVALYGAQIHAVISDRQNYIKRLTNLFISENINILAIEKIAPTLEDVFISAVHAPV